MSKFETCFRQLICLAFICFVLPLSAQQSGTELTVDLRVNQLQRAFDWYGKGDYAQCRQTIDSLVHDPAGDLIIDSLSGLAYHMAGMSYYQVYDDVNAAPQYLQAISIRDQCYPTIHNDQAHTRYNLANSMHWLGRPDTATYLLREAMDLYDQLERKDSTNWLRSLKLLGVIAKESNDSDLTRSTTVAMVNLLEIMSEPTLLDRYQVYYDAANNYRDLQNFEESERTGKAAIAAGFALNGTMPAKNAVSMAADAVNTVASNHLLMGDYETAADYYRRSIHLLDSISGDPTSINIAYGNLATMHLNLRDYATALAYTVKAEEYPFNPDYPAKEASAYNDHGQILGLLGRHREAMNYIAKSMTHLAANGVNTSGPYPMMVPDSIIDLSIGFLIYANRAAILQELGESEAAVADLRKLFELQNLQRERVNSDDSRYLLSNEVREYYDKAIDLLYKLHAGGGTEDLLWEAFTLSEEAKAYSQLAALSRNDAVTTRREQDLRRQIALLEREAANIPSKEVALADVKLRLSLILRSEERPEGKKITPLDRSTLQSFLAKQDVELLEYHLNERKGPTATSGSYLFHLKPDGSLRMIALETSGGLQAEVNGWRAAIRESAYRRKSLRDDQASLDAAFLSQGRELQAILLPGLELGELALGKRLCIIPDGSLNYLPFAALPLAGSDGSVDYSTVPYLQTGRTLQMAYSVHYLMELQRREKPVFTGDLLAFAPSFNGEATPEQLTDARSQRSAETFSLNGPDGLPGLLPLSHNQSEVAAIADLLPSHEVYFDQAATREAFLSALGGSRILHLSSHGMVNAKDANLSFVAFAQDGTTLEEEELLYFNDLSTLPLDVEMVVLSACETSLGKVVPGESVMSLGSAFAAAGARSTLTSLWKVDDAATEDLMIGFYEALAAGETRAEALAQAQNLQRENGNYAHPYYWSAMTLTGEAGVLPIEKRSGWWMWLVGGLIVLGGLVLLLRKN